METPALTSTSPDIHVNVWEHGWGPSRRGRGKIQAIQKYQCTFCPKYFYTKTELVRHLRVHTGEKPYACDVCSKCFKSNQAMKYHRIQAHQPYL